MGHKISHSGVIESFGDGCVHVCIVQTSACAACKVAGHCHAAESKEKLVDVYCDPVARQLQVGQTVMISASTQVATHALLLGFGLPFIVLVAVLIIGFHFDCSSSAGRYRSDSCTGALCLLQEIRGL